MSNILFGVSFILQPEVLILVFLGTLLGLVFGAIPGLTSTLGIILLLPITFGMDPSVGLAMLCAIYVGGVSGGKISAILLNMPGTPASIATVFDGYPMTQKGFPGKAISYGVISSLFGGLLSLLVLATVAPIVGRFALAFQTYEYFLLGVFGLTVVASISGDSVLDGVISAFVGLLIATIGADPLSGTSRFTFGLYQLDGGIQLLPAMIGLFVIAEIYKQVQEKEQEFVFQAKKLDSMRIKFSEIIIHWKNLIRSSLIGIGLGILPGAGATLANFIAYDQAKKYSKYPEKFGTGIPDGIIAPEAANNAVSCSAFIPMMTLGIPGNSVTAVLLAGLLLHGLNPGPTLFAENIDVVYSIFAALFLSYIIMFILQYTVMIKFFTWALKVPKKILMPIIILMSIAGTYNVRYSFNDLYILFFFGVVGFLLKKFKFPITPLILGLILGPMMERSLRTGLMRTGGNFMPFITRPYSIALIILTLFTIAISFIINKKQKEFKVEKEES